jgi:hypothetical protein
MTLISAYGPLNYAGCFAATLSSALASFVSCPKLLEVIGQDNLYPYWLVGFLAKGYGKSNEPVLAYAFTFVLALVFILIGRPSIVKRLEHSNLRNKSLLTCSKSGYSCSSNIQFFPRHFCPDELFNISRQLSQTTRMATHFQSNLDTSLTLQKQMF